jgi:hypothetical protein
MPAATKGSIYVDPVRPDRERLQDLFQKYRLVW